MAKEINKIENVVVVGGVSLTEKAIVRLQQLQNHDNSGIDYMTKTIQQAIRTIVRDLGNFDHAELEKIQTLLSNMACVCDWIEALEKP